MKRIILLVTVCAAPAFGQQGAELPSEAACQALKERVQIALAQADRSLQGDDTEAVETWTSIAANYAETHATFCRQPDE